MSDFPKTFATMAQAQWSALVNLVLDGEDVEVLAKECSMDLALLKRKRDAIRFKREQGFGREVIIANGQSWTLSGYARAKRNGNEPQRILRWRISRRLADAIMSSETSPDQEEALVSRLVRVCGLRTSEDFWEFINSVFADWSDADLLHHSGEATGKRGKP